MSKNMKKVFTVIAAALVALTAAADEGMWLLPLLQKMNKKDLREAGCKLSPDEIYSINHSSLKDAIVQFGGGCTGEIISDEGLIVTNHHCGYSNIQALSTPEHNYLMDGYFALTRDKEIPCPGLSVTFLKEMTDITAILARESDDAAREAKVKELIKSAQDANPLCKVITENFYNDNVEYLIVYKVFKDVRFVGAPPASVGKYGGETDNWMWPRHTGDFSMFRVYASPENEPAEYSEENVPFRPERHLKISLKGVKENDYSMILGYPGRTQRFQTAAQLEQMVKENRVRIDVRTVRQDLMWDAMCADPAVQLMYASKYASSANGWKKWQGEELAFKKLDIIGREKAKEAAFMNWVNQDPARVEAYGGALDKISSAVESISEPELALTLLTEAPFRIELVTAVSRFSNALSSVLRENPDAGKEVFVNAAKSLESFYRDYVEPLDRKEAVALLSYYRDHADKAHYLDSLGVGFEDFASMDIPAYVDSLFDASIFTSQKKLAAALESEDYKEIITKDPANLLYTAIITKAMALYPTLYQAQTPLAEGSKAFAAGLLDWEKGKPSYPDANFTMRLTYGNVLPYSPKDAVYYQYYTTLEGVMEKEDPTNPEFIVPAKLKELYEARDYGRYADKKDGKIHTCFLTNNDITGGNSGSPVLNAKGELIGLAFDGNWESMSSDVMFEPDLQRCICVDIRYVLFLVEKLGGASNIIAELDFAK